MRLCSFALAASLVLATGARAQGAGPPAPAPVVDGEDGVDEVQGVEEVQEAAPAADAGVAAPAPPPPSTSTATPTTPPADAAAPATAPADPADRPGRSPSSLGLALLGGGAALGAVTAVASVMVESFANDPDDPLTNDLIAQSAGFVSLGLASASIAMALVGGGLIVQETLLDSGPGPAPPATAAAAR